MGFIWDYRWPHSVLSTNAERTVVCLDNHSRKKRLQERQTWDPYTCRKFLIPKPLALPPQESKPGFSLGRPFSSLCEAALRPHWCYSVLSVEGLSPNPPPPKPNRNSIKVYGHPEPFVSSWFAVLFFWKQDCSSSRWESDLSAGNTHRSVGSFWGNTRQSFPKC